MKFICPDCGTQYESGKFCLECGTKLQEVTPELVCSSCGYKVKTGKFCPECGTKLTEQSESSKESVEKETAERKFNERDQRFAKYYDKKGFPRTIPQEEREVAIEELTPFASQNNAEAKMLLGGILVNDPNTDIKLKGGKLIKEAEDLGDKCAYYLMGMLYFYGYDTVAEQNHDEAEKRLLEAYQEYQDGESAGLLAELYTLSSVKCDYKKAFEYATIAAEDDARDGFLILGELYLNGWGVEKDINRALENYKMAAALGDGNAMNQIGFIFMGDEDFEKNPEQSFYWFNEAAKKGSDVGMYNLGWCYMNGFGVDVDVEKAAEWFKKAAELDYVDAMFELGEYYQNNLVDVNKAKMWYLKAAELGHAQAQNNLAVIYANIDNDYQEAIKWYKIAIEQDNSWAYRNYAYCLWNGDGVEENKKEAIEFMQKAISLGHPDAEKELTEMQQELVNNKKEKAKDSKPEKMEVKKQTEDIIIENVKFSTDGRKKLFMEFECEYNRKYKELGINFSGYVNNKVLAGVVETYGCGVQLAKNREKFSFEISDYELNLKTNQINDITLTIEARNTNGAFGGINPKDFPLITSCRINLKLYYEFHMFGKNVLEIK